MQERNLSVSCLPRFLPFLRNLAASAVLTTTRTAASLREGPGDGQPLIVAAVPPPTPSREEAVDFRHSHEVGTRADI